ncbi:SDR family NAD(P)-dependent oxidoreductase [Paracoccaceae bacterium]|nr:SDR family NAD(P)-dependent oxidoreductase [Paracoccaceae bacterium]
MTKSVLIVGAGLGLSSSLAKCCADQGMKVALAARNLDKLEAIARETNAELYQCDASSVDDVAELFARLDASIGTPEMVIYNPSSRVHGPVQELDPVKVQDALNITCYGAFLVAQQAAQRMLVQGHGSIFFYRSNGWHKRLCEFVSLCDGQVWSARVGAITGP